MRQNAGPIRALAGFERLISAIKYQELMPDPFKWDPAIAGMNGNIGYT